MSLSGYQVEKVLLELYEKQNTAKHTLASQSDRLSLSEDAKRSSRHRTPASSSPPVDWITPQNILNWIADTTALPPVIDYEQQRRAGQFMNPPWVPQSPIPPFAKVKDHREKTASSDQGESPDKNLGAYSRNQGSTEQDSAFIPVPPSIQDDSEFTLDLELDLEPELDTGQELLLEPELDTGSDLASEYESKLLLEVEQPLESNLEQSTDPSGLEAELPSQLDQQEDQVATQAPVSSADLLFDLDDEEEDDEGLSGASTGDSEVVFGIGKVTAESVSRFVETYTDSAVQFLFRRQVDGRPLSPAYHEIYEGWQGRGLSRKRLKAYILKMMDWKEVPDLPLHILLRKLKDRLYDLKNL